MEIVLGLVGFFVGLFLWSFILGGLFGLLPTRRKLYKAGKVKHIGWLKIMLVVAIPTVILILTAIFINPFFIGTLPAGLVMLFNVGKVNNGIRQSELDKLEVNDER